MLDNFELDAEGAQALPELGPGSRNLGDFQDKTLNPKP